MAKRIVDRSGKVRQPISEPGPISEEAELISQYARSILTEKYGNADWIHQAVSVVLLSVDRAVAQLSGSALKQNSDTLNNGANYVMPARNKEELLATTHLVADFREIGRNDEPKESVSEPEVKKESEKKWLL